jgi:O-antigen ligase
MDIRVLGIDLSIRKSSDVIFCGLVLIAFTIPLSSFVSTRLCVLVAAWALMKSTQTSWKRLSQTAWDIGIFLLVIVLGLTYTEDLTTGLRLLETSSSFLLLPIIFSTIDKSEGRISIAHYAFGAGLLITIVVCLANAAARYSHSGDGQAFLFVNFVEIMHFQPTYLAYYIIFGITYLLYSVYYQTTPLNSKGVIALCVLYFVGLVLTGGRTTFMSLLLVLSFFVLKYMLEERTFTKSLVVGTVCLMIIVMFVVNSLDDWNPGMTDYWERSALWESAIDANPSPIFGVGTGDQVTELNSYLRGHDMATFADESYNAHNQFIQTYFSNGLIGLIALLILVARPLFISVRNQTPLGVLVFFPFIIYGMTEVFLGRYQGIVFFVFLHQLIVTQMSLERPAIGLKPGGF